MTSAAAATDQQRPHRSRLPAGPVRADWVALAQAAKPSLIESLMTSPALVVPRPAPTTLMRHIMLSDPGPALDQRALDTGESVILDFGRHLVGHFSCRIEALGRPADAPARLRLVFGEVPGDVAEPLHPYKSAIISEAWLPEEIVTVDDLPATLRVARRHAFRYVRVEVLAASHRFRVGLRDACVHAVTSAHTVPGALPESVPADLARIDAVSIATLRDCMQTVFEDGPRRDRRLWLGDLRLQALAAYETFGAHDLVRRCLYLFAAFPRADGMVNACVYEHPAPAYGDSFILDYAALFTAALNDYVAASGDLQAGRDLWPVALRQIELVHEKVGAQGLFLPPDDISQFIDWSPVLDRTAAMQGLILYCTDHLLALAARIGVTFDAAPWRARMDWMRHAARRAFRGPSGAYVSGPARQVSWASQAWLVLGGVPTSRGEGARALLAAMADPAAVRPNTPYLHHYVLDAMLTTGMRDEALALLRRYWGAMVEGGVDTFWEVFDPADPAASPYGDIHANSFCHAWSCTPTYFLRTRKPGRLLGE